MPKTLVLKSQANEVFSMIQSAGLIPSEFRWNEVASAFESGLIVSELRHVQSGYYFRFDFKERKQFCEFSPGSEARIERQFPGNWMFSIQHIHLWLVCLKRELTEPDLWESVSQERVLLEAASSTQDDNRPFDRTELSRITAGLRELNEHIQKTEQLDGERQAFVTRRLQYLEEAASRLGRKDWINIAAGVLTNIVVGAMFSSGAARELFRLAGVVFEWLVHAPHLLN